MGQDSGKGAVDVFGPGDKVVTLGVSPVSGLGLPITIGAEYGLNSKIKKGTIGVGGLLGYAKKAYNIPVFGKYSVNNILIGARGNFHYPLIDQIDTYAGITLGYNIATANYPANWIGATQSYGGIFMGGNLGGRYYFSKNLAGMAEVGAGGLGYVTLGIAYKL
jgi:hypothetical protein